MHTAHILLFLVTLGVVSAEFSYPELTHDCNIVNIKNHKSNTVLECKCKTESGELTSCQATLGDFLVNDYDKLQPEFNGAASATCTKPSLFEPATLLSADCGGEAVSFIGLDEICDVDSSEKLSCGEQTGTGSSTTTSSTTESSSMTPLSTQQAASASGNSKKSSVSSYSCTEHTSVKPGSTSAPDVMTTSAARSASTDTAGSCGSVERRMRIMNR